MRLAPYVVLMLSGLVPAAASCAASPAAVHQEVVKYMESRAKAPTSNPPLPDVTRDPVDQALPGKQRSATVRAANKAARNASRDRAGEAARKAMEAGAARAEEKVEDAASEERSKDLVKKKD